MAFSSRVDVFFSIVLPALYQKRERKNYKFMSVSQRKLAAWLGAERFTDKREEVLLSVGAKNEVGVVKYGGRYIFFEIEDAMYKSIDLTSYDKEIERAINHFEKYIGSVAVDEEAEKYKWPSALKPVTWDD